MQLARCASVRRTRARRSAHSHCPPSSTETGLASPAHWIVQVESPLQFREQESVHCTLHVEPSLQSMLALVPTTRSHVEPPLQSTLQDEPQVPVHSLSSAHSSVQLLPLHPELPMSQAAPAGQEHVDPVQSGGGGDSLPQAPRRDKVRMSRRCMRSTLATQLRAEPVHFLRNTTASRMVEPLSQWSIATAAVAGRSRGCPGASLAT